MDRTTQKHIIGFDKGYIWVVKHSISEVEDEILNKSNARYSKKFGWYFFDKPDELPEKYKIYKLNWEEVGNEDGSLKSEIYIDAPTSIGKIGDRIEITVEVVDAEDAGDRWGNKRTHIFSDGENEYVWATTAKRWEVGSSHHIRGTIKEFADGRCVLTRCMER